MTIHITFGYWLIPTFLTLVCLGMMLRPLDKSSGGDYASVGNALEAAFRLGWLIPVGFIWVIYLVILLWIRG